MAEPFLGEIRMFAGNFAPKGWAFCDGQLLPINQNQALFALLGFQYGGNGQTTFALPDLRGRVALHRSDAFPIGDRAGVEQVSLSLAQLPTHSHAAQAQSGPGDSPFPANALWAASALHQFSGNPATANMSPTALGSVGGGPSPHENMAPFLTITFIIALQGVFPSRD